MLNLSGVHGFYSLYLMDGARGFVIGKKISICMNLEITLAGMDGALTLRLLHSFAGWSCGRKVLCIPHLSLLITSACLSRARVLGSLWVFMHA